MKRGTPLITTLPYAYEAFRDVYALDKDEQWQRVMRSIADHALLDYQDLPTSSSAASCGYTPTPPTRAVWSTPAPTGLGF